MSAYHPWLRADRLEITSVSLASDASLLPAKFPFRTLAVEQ
jgi:hypothetical protein